LGKGRYGIQKRPLRTRTHVTSRSVLCALADFAGGAPTNTNKVEMWPHKSCCGRTIGERDIRCGRERCSTRLSRGKLDAMENNTESERRKL
jgi:hypothetical protein